MASKPVSSSREWWAVAPDDLLRDLQTNLQTGLTDAEAQARLQRDGINGFPEEEEETLFEQLWEAFTDPLALVLIAAASLSGGIGIVEGSSDELRQAGLILGIVIFMTIVSYLTDRSAGNALKKLKSMQIPFTRVIRNGTIVEIESQNVVVGDVLVLSEGDHVVADGRIVQAVNAMANEATFTGEPETVKNEESLSTDTELSERHNMVHSGTYIVSGNLTAVVTGTGLNTELGHIYEELRETDKSVTPLQRQLDQLGKMLMIGTLVVCVLVVLIYIVFQDYPILDALVVAVALAIAFIPEALGAIITIALALGVREMVTKKTIIRELKAAEGLGSVSIICTDKTGTITYGQMTPTHIWTNSLDEREVGTLDFNNLNLELRKLIDVIRYCNNLNGSSEAALTKLAEKAGIIITNADIQTRIGEIPFNSHRKQMTTLTPYENGFMLRSKGAPEAVLAKCSHFIDGETIKALTESEKQRIVAEMDHFAEQGYRVFGFAERFSETDLSPIDDSHEQDYTFLGLVALSDPPRPEVARTIELLKGAHIYAKMITGDNPKTALAIAKQVGLVSQDATLDTVVDGKLLQQLLPDSADGGEKRHWDETNERRVAQAAIFARVTPADKIKIVRALQNQGYLVAMTGDGVNDAAAIKQSNVGIAIEPCTDMAREVSQVVLTGAYEAIASAVQVGRTILYRTRLYIHALLSTNGAEVGIFIVAALAGWSVPLTAVQLLVINLLGDSWLSMALAVEKEEADVMQKPPRPPSESVITQYMWFSIGLQSLVATIVMAMAFLVARDHTETIMGLGESDEKALAIQQTAIFVAFMTQKILRSAFTARSLSFNLWEIGFFTNPWSLAAAALTVVIALLSIFVLPTGMEAVPSEILPYLFGFGLIPPLVEELAKFAWKNIKPTMS